MFAIVSLAAGAAVTSNGFGVSYGPGAGGFNLLGLHEGAQVNGAAYYWQPKPSSDLMSTGMGRRQKGASGCKGNYIGSDCEQRVCPYGLSSNTSPYLKNGLSSQESNDDYIYAPTSRLSECTLVDGQCNYDDFRGDTDRFLGSHTYVECSQKGACDRETGVCECFEGFTGVGCRYTTCPNSCSGHGQCKQNARVNTDYDTPNNALFHGSQYWDAHITMRCVCDRGFSGYDCSERICPHGDDILTTCVTGEADVQTVDLEFAATMSGYTEHAKFFTLTFTDNYNGVYDTPPIAIMDDPIATASLTQIALEGLPNQALPSIQVRGSQTGNTQSMAITFSDASTPGLQRDLGCNVRYGNAVCASGQQPLIDSDLTEADLTCSNVGHNSDDPADYEENVECGNRGICDKSTGKCECFDGHSGEACEVASVFV